MQERPGYSNDIISLECGFSSRTYLYRILRLRKVALLLNGEPDRQSLKSQSDIA